MLYIQQLDETDCGAACLAMVASHYKKKKSIASIRDIAGTDTQGTTLSGMVHAGKMLGFSTHALKGSKDSLSSELPFPFIAHIVYSEHDYSLLHYVVVKSIKKDKIEIWDPNPEKGKHKKTLEDFCKQWTGYAIFLNNKNDVKIDNEKSSMLINFLSLIKPYRFLLLLACMASFLLVILGIISSLYTRYVIDEIIFSNAKSTLAALSIGMLIMVVIQGIIGAMRNILLVHFSYKIDLNLIFSYFTHVFHLPMKFFDSRKSGEIISRLQDIGKIQELLSEAVVSVVMDIIMLIIVVPILFFTNKTLFGITLITVPFSGIIIYIFSKLYKRQYRKLMINAAEVESCLIENINGIGTTKALNAEYSVMHLFEKKQMNMTSVGWKAAHYQIYQQLFSDVVKQIGNILVFWFGSLLIIRGNLSIGTLVSFTTLSSFFTEPLQRLVKLQSKLQEGYVATERLGEIFELETEQNTERKLVQLTSLSEKIEIKNVWFRYGRKKSLYENLNITIQSGQKVAIVGPSGCGKTSLIKLLLKLYIPESGRIQFDEYDILDIDIHSLRSLIGYVPQNINLFSGTIAENIALHKPSATLEEIKFAARQANASDFIEELSDRYETQLGERGVNLSGGERQRIALARALLCDPKILILDEATSNLDSVSEQNIKETINRLHKNKVTIIVIAHRLSTIYDCDRIFVMDNGSIVQEGTHDELKRQGGLYKKLLDNVM